MTDHMQLQRKTVGQSSDTPTPVISSPASSTATALQLAPEPPAQAEPKAESAEQASEQERQPSLLNHDFGRIPILPKLSVSQPNDPYEQEADRVAEQVMRMPDQNPDASPSVQGFVGHDFGQIALSPQLQPIAQRKCAACEAEEEEKLLRKENKDGIGDIGSLESKLAGSQGGGEPLSDDVRAFMGPRFGFDFSQIRIHTDASAVEMNEAIHAQAFTHGNDIYFNAGKYAPETQEGKQLLAHELTHTVQQTRGRTLGSANHFQPEENIQDNELLQTKAISKAPFSLISLKAIPSVGASTPSPAPQLDTSSSEGLLQSLSNTPASSLSQAVHQAKGATGQIQTQEKQALETNLPEQESSTGLPRRSSRLQAKATTLEPGEAPAPKLASGQAKKEFGIEHKAAEGAVPGSNVSTEASAPNDLDGWLSWLTGRISSFLKDIPTKDSSLNTSAGERPTVDLEGEADPNQSDQYQRDSDQEIKARQRQADQAAAEDFGENDIYPTIPTQRLRSSHQLTSPQTLAGRGQNPPPLPDDIRASFDENETPKLSPKLQHQLGHYQAKEAKHQQESQQIRQEGQNRIDQETGRVRDQQTGLQQQAQGAVNAERQSWREENQRIQEEYNNQAQVKRRDLDQQVQDQVETTDRETDRKLTEAEQRAESEQRRTEREAEAQKQELENKPQNFWEQAKDAISSLFEGLRRNIERLFEGLRRLVQQIIEAAKTVVRALIEAARQVIVTLIRGFGEVLKGLVTVALFAFPETAARAREWIDERVDTAVEQVNEAAERLTQFTDAALDWIGQRLDDALNLLQGAFNIALDVAEFLATAPLEIMNQIAQIMDWLQENGGLIGAIQRLEQSAGEVEAAAKEMLQGYVDQIPEELERQLDEANLEALSPHWDEVWQYVQQDFEKLKTGWWDAVKDMLWTWIWPFHENSPVCQDWPKFTEELGNCFNHIKAGEYSEAIDSFLKASQLLTGIIDAFFLWFTIAVVIIGAVIGSIIPGLGTIAGAKAGLEVAGVVGTVLSVFSFATEAGILGKAIYDVSTGENTEAENDEDYQAIASSGVAVTTEIVFAGIGFLIGAAAGSTIGTKIGHSIASAIVKMLRKIPYKPRPGRADLPDVEPDLDAPEGDRTDGADTDGTDGDGGTPETEGQTDSNGSGDGGRDTPETQDGTDEPQTTEPSTTDTDPVQTPDQPRDQSTGDGSETTTPDTTPDRPVEDSPQSTQSPDADTRPADQPSNGRLTDEQLTEGLPPDLQGQVPVRVNPELSGNTVRVYYTRNGDGTVGDIRIEAGPDARRVDIELHAETVRLMQRYSGLSGRIRILKERIENWIGRNGEPPVGSRAWEAKLEIEKLPRIIDERLERLSRGDLDAQAEADLRADIENLEQQLDQHQQTLDEMDTDPGVGFVAAEGATPSQSRAEQLEQQAELEASEMLSDLPNPDNPDELIDFDPYELPQRIPVPDGNPVSGSTPANRLGTRMHAMRARARTTGGRLENGTHDLELDDEFDGVNSPITDRNGNVILVPEYVDLQTGQPKPGTRLEYRPRPDAVKFDEGKIIDDKPIGRPLGWDDRQEIIRFITAFEMREGRLPEAIEIHRYDPDTGQTVGIEVYPPEDFVPWRSRTANGRTPTAGGQTQTHSSGQGQSPTAQNSLGEQSTPPEHSSRDRSEPTNLPVQERDRLLEYESQQLDNSPEEGLSPQEGQGEPDQLPEDRSGNSDHSLGEEQEKSETVSSEREALTAELAKQSIKHNPEEIVRIARQPNGKIVFLEEGNPKAGLQHIIKRHGDEFASKGIPEEVLPDFLISALVEGRVVGSQRGRPIYEVVFNGERYRAAITVGDNGFIVGANPRSLPSS